MLPAVPERALTELGRTEGGPETLGLLVRDQHTRRLLLLRAVLDAAEAADPAVCSAAARARLRDDWALLEEADRVERPGRVHRGPVSSVRTEGGYAGLPDDPGTRGGDLGPHGERRTRGDLGPHGDRWTQGRLGTYPDPGPPPDPAPHAEPVTQADLAVHTDPVVRGAAEAVSALAAPPLSSVRALLLHPFVGPWARHCLSGLGTLPGPRTNRDTHELACGLVHFGALAAAAATRAGIAFAVRLTALDGVLTLPSLGALRTHTAGDTSVDVVHRRGRLTFRRAGAADVVVHVQTGVGAWSDAAAWTPAHALPGLLPGSAPVPLDDLDPYRTARGGSRPHTLSGPVTLDDEERKHWLHAWSGTASELGLGGAQRLAEAVSLLRCLVPLSAPPGSLPGGRPGGSCSVTRREAFGAVLSSTPAGPTALAATLVHEVQHTKLAALTDMLPLHHAGATARYFAPWRPDPRPYDGLLQGTYSHLALADFFQRRALAADRPADRDAAWAQHARYQEQVGAALPTLVGSGDLTEPGRRFVNQMVRMYERLAERPAPRGQAVRAAAYVRAARALWTQRHAPAE
ncbi:HEXXH motif-containing putative peptide modification protein [Streptomyces sp. NPDC005813]|uniref:aKG-HExxH-type peptide beta-hydroxylase n=1 Tax=Streptomyces sp. NPDC005813 TaxID=3155592 RepID=UPI0033EB954C